MKMLYLVRHAKASWENANETDFDRPLTEVGYADIKAMTKQLKELNVKPNLMIASPAKRALETAVAMAKELSYPEKNIITDMCIYNGSVEEMVERIKQVDSKVTTLFFVGHNPGLTWLAHFLCDEAKMNIPTCGIVAVKLNTSSWSHLSDAKAQLITFIHPAHDPAASAI